MKIKLSSLKALGISAGLTVIAGLAGYYLTMAGAFLIAVFFLYDLISGPEDYEP